MIYCIERLGEVQEHTYCMRKIINGLCNFIHESEKGMGRTMLLAKAELRGGENILVVKKRGCASINDLF